MSPHGSPTRIVLAEDHHLVREGLRALLEAEPGLAIVGEAAEGSEVPEVVARLDPDILLLDWLMQGVGGGATVREVLERCPRTRVVILSLYDNVAYVDEALRSGASGYVLKGARSDELVAAITEACAGRCYLSPPLSEGALADYRRRALAAPVDPFATLTQREREVLQLAADGLNNPQIGAQLKISARTVEVHRLNMMRKLGLRSQTDIVRFAMRRGVGGKVS
jgi:DNA-binding NarL/FixJ family response regulator